MLVVKIKSVLCGHYYQSTQGLIFVVDSNDKDRILDCTLFEKLYNLSIMDLKRTLIVQYRSHKQIMDFSSKTWYNNALLSDESVAEKTIKSKIEWDKYFELTNNLSNKKRVKSSKEIWIEVSKYIMKIDPIGILGYPLIFVNTNGCYREKSISTTQYNIGETSIVFWFN